MTIRLGFPTPPRANPRKSPYLIFFISGPTIHPGRILKRALATRDLSANRLAILLGVPSGRMSDFLNGRRSISAGTALRLGRYFGSNPQFWISLQGQYDIAVAERESGDDI